MTVDQEGSTEKPRHYNRDQIGLFAAMLMPAAMAERLAIRRRYDGSPVACLSEEDLGAAAVEAVNAAEALENEIKGRCS